MSGQSRPWMKFYPGDWRADPLLRQCEPISRYVWLEMIGLMHEAEPYGHLIFAGKPMGPAKLARLIAMDTAEVESALEDLEALGVFSRDKDQIIYSRRMVRDEEKYRRAAKFGKRGANAKARKEKENPPPLKGSLEDSPEGSQEGSLKPRVQRPDTPPLDPPSSRARPKRPIPDDWAPEEFGADSQCAKIVAGWSRLELERQIEKFSAHHRGKGSRFADWQAAWKTWVLNSASFAQPAGAKSQSPGGGDFIDLVRREHGLDDDEPDG